MRKLLLILFFLPVAAFAQTAATVTAHLRSDLGPPLGGNSYIVIRLRNFAGFVPRVIGTGTIARIDSGPIKTDGAGFISTSAWKNSDITPANTFYTIEFWDQGKMTSQANWIINADPFNLDTQAPITTPPTPYFGIVVLQNPIAGQDQHITQQSGTTFTFDGAGTFDFSAATLNMPQKADLVGGKVPTAELGSGPALATTCLLGNQTWAACPGSGATGFYYNVNDYGMIGDGTTVNTAAMSSLLTSIGAAKGNLIFPAGTYVLGNITFPSNVTVDFSAGGVLKPLTDTTPAGGAAIDIPGSGSSFNTSTNSCSITVTPTVATEAYWIYTVHSFASGTAAQPTSNVPTDVVPVIPSYQSNTNQSMMSEGWLVPNVVAGARTFTFSYAGTGWVGCGGIAVAGLGPTPSVVSSVSAQGTTTPMSSGAATVQAGSFILGYGGQHNDTLTCTAGAGFTQPAGTVGNYGTSGTVCTEYINSSSAGALTATQNMSVSPTGLAWTYNQIELRPGSATISILGPLNATPRQIFTNALGGQGKFDFTGNSIIPTIYPEWWGAAPSASAATNTPALQAAEHGAFGTGRTNASGLSKYNRELWLSGNYQINDELQFYHVIGFRIACANRLNGGITQTAVNKRIIDAQSMAYGVFQDCSWSTTASQTVPLLDIDYSAAQGVDLAPQFIDFLHNNFSGNGLGQIGILLSKSGGGAQGSNVNFFNTAGSGFTAAVLQIGGNNTGINVGRFPALNALDNSWYQGDIQSSPLYGIAAYGGQVFVHDATFENNFTTQTGFDVYCEAPQAPGCYMENIRSESRRLASGVQYIKNSFTINQAQAPVGGVGMPVGTYIMGSKVGGDGKYYKVTVDSSPIGGVGSPSALQSATSGSATTIVNSLAAYTINAFVAMRASILSGTGIGEYCIVTANTATDITCAAGWATQYQYLTIVNPDSSSRFLVEPDWGTQFTSGGVTWVDPAENGIDGSAGASGAMELKNVQMPGLRVHLTASGSNATSRVDGLTVTRADWCNCGFILDNNVLTAEFRHIYVFPGATASGIGPLAVSGGFKYIPWSFVRNGSTQVSEYSQSNFGTEQVVWSCGANGGGTRCLDVGIGGRHDNAAAASVSRNVLEVLGTIGPKTPFGTDQNGTSLGIQGGLPTGAGTPGNINFYLGNVGSSGASVIDGSIVGKWTPQGFGFFLSKGQHFLNQAANNDMAGTCTFSSTTCTVTFTTAYTATPSCVANDRTAAAPIQSAPTTTNVVFTGGTGAGATDVINYVCVGNPN